MKITSDESEWQRRLGSAHCPRHTSAHSAQVEGEIVKQPNAKRETVEQKTEPDTAQQLADKIEACQGCLRIGHKDKVITASSVA